MACGAGRLPVFLASNGISQITVTLLKKSVPKIMEGEEPTAGLAQWPKDSEHRKAA